MRTLSFNKFKLALHDRLLTLGTLYETSISMETMQSVYRDATGEELFTDQGHVVAFLDGKLTTMWDVSVGGKYQQVADAMHAAVGYYPIRGVVGRPEARRDHERLRRAMLKITPGAIKVIEGLVEAGALAGDDETEARHLVEMRRQYEQIIDLAAVDDWLWQQPGNSTGGRVGRLLLRLSDGATLSAALEEILDARDDS